MRFSHFWPDLWPPQWWYIIKLKILSFISISQLVDKFTIKTKSEYSFNKISKLRRKSQYFLHSSSTEWLIYVCKSLISKAHGILIYLMLKRFILCFLTEGCNQKIVKMHCLFLKRVHLIYVNIRKKNSKKFQCRMFLIKIRAYQAVIFFTARKL